MMVKNLIYTIYALGITGFVLSTGIVHATETPWDREAWILSLQSSPESEKRLQDWHQLIQKGEMQLRKEQKKENYQRNLTLNEWLKASLWRATDEGSLWAYRQLSSGNMTSHTYKVSYKPNDRAGLESRQYTHLPDFEYYAGFSGLKYLPPLQQEIRAKREREGKSLNVVPLSHSLMSIEEDFEADESCWNGRRQIVDRMPSLMGRCFSSSEYQRWRQMVEGYILTNLTPWIRKGAMTAAQEGLDLYVDPVSVVKRWQKEPDHQAILKASSPLSSMKADSSKERDPVASFSSSRSKQDTDYEGECEEKIRLRHVNNEEPSR